MGQQILIALDESDNAMRAVGFVCTHFTPEHRVTLMSVVPDTAALCRMNGPGLTPYFMSQKDAFCSIEDKKQEFLASAMEEARGRLVQAGFQEDCVTMKAETQKKGVARDLLAEAAKGYDAIVLGRRGLSGVQEFFMGSVTQKVLHGAGEIPVILVS